MTALPYRVECKGTRPYYELIAAFDCEEAAEAYAGQCALANVNTPRSYRVKRGELLLRQFGPNE